MKNQYDFQREILEKTGLNIVTCGECGSTIIHKSDDNVIVCEDCGFIGEACDFPDLNYQIMEKPRLMVYAKKQHKILDEVFLSNDTEENKPFEIYNVNFDNTYFFGIHKDELKFWVLTDNFHSIVAEHKDEILEYRYGKGATGDVMLSDIFMHGKFIKEVTEQDFLNDYINRAYKLE